MGLVSRKLLPISLISILVMLGACSSNDHSKIQLIDKSRNYRSTIKTSTIPHSGKVVQSYTSSGYSTGGKHIVQQGETLYSLAFNGGRDWRDLAASNNIRAPYIIYPGQVIYLSGNAPTTSNKSKVTTGKTTVNKSIATKPTISKPMPRPTTAIVGGWTWPAIGTVIGTYSLKGNLNKGIDIAAREGTSIMAAANGTVVYAGNNLHGYGNLLIIKHNDSFVSAYGHNRSLLVKEGQKVKIGQKIAEMGSTGADRVKLHFEIRLNGKPVDPVRYLPKK